MSRRLAWLGAVLVVCAAACADIWQFSDLQVGPSEDATTVQESAAPDSNFADSRIDAPSDGHVDAKGGDVVSDVLDAGQASLIPDGFPADQCPTTLCSGQCVDTQTDPAHCASCGTPCAKGAMCLAGACKCPSAQSTPCNGACVDLASDHGNCGGCGNACPASYRCSNKTCIPCQSTDKMCSGVCVDVTSDVNNCGSCGVACPSGATCVSGSCTCPTTDPSACALSGDAGQQCVNTTNDHNNCGSCSNVCTLSHATSVCTGSSCAIAACTPGYVDCDQQASDGCEVNTTNDTNNCGGCGRVCAPAHATPACLASFCLIGSCSPGYADCDLIPYNGCEVNIAGDPANCGSCGTVCSPAHATAGCTMGNCTIASCDTGFADCDLDASNGCETDLSQPTHCGSCTNACAAGMLCSAGSCVSMCTSPMPTICNGSYCANTTNDVNNCGSCGRVCSLPHATATCTSSQCAVASCAAGYIHCSTTTSDGCEVNSTNDVSNCGGCGKACVLVNATATCSASNCAIKSCNTGFANCDGMAMNGCMVNTTNDPANCGACGTKCTGGMTCQNSVCACPAGTHACNGTCLSNTDPNSCGSMCMACTPPTNGVATCMGSMPTCGVSCSNSTYPNLCMTTPTPACVNFTNDPTNCGNCGVTCPTGGSCSSSTCSCPGGLMNCGPAPGTCAACTAPTNGATACVTDGGPSCVATCNMASLPNLCPGSPGACVNFTNDNSNCGGCGTSCTTVTGSSCTNSTCQCPSGQHACSNACVAVGPSSCGSSCATCQTPLEGGTATCDGSACGGTCPGSLTLCTVSGNLACVDTTVDSNNCGSCGHACSALSDGGPPACSSSICSM